MGLTSCKIPLMFFFLRAECIRFPTLSAVSGVGAEHGRPDAVSALHSHMQTARGKTPRTQEHIT